MTQSVVPAPHGFLRSADGGGVHIFGDWLALRAGISDIFLTSGTPLSRSFPNMGSTTQPGEHGRYKVGHLSWKRQNPLCKRQVIPTWASGRFRKPAVTRTLSQLNSPFIFNRPRHLARTREGKMAKDTQYACAHSLSFSHWSVTSDET